MDRPNVVIEYLTPSKVRVHVSSNKQPTKSYKASITKEYLEQMIDQYLTIGFQVSVTDNQHNYSM